MNSKKVLAVLGGGSVWTPYFLKELVEHGLNSRLQIRLQGITESHLREVMAFSRCFVKEPLDIKVMDNLEEAVGGAAVILNQVRIGGWAARLKAETFPVPLGGIGDESLGAGGLLNALRTWPFVRHASRIILQHTEDAWLLNLTNPSDLVSRAWCEVGCQRVLSLCDYPQKLAREMATLLEKPETAFQFGFIGMNHVGWLIPPFGVQLHLLLQKRPELLSWNREWGALPTPWCMVMADPHRFFNEQQLHPGFRAGQLSQLVENLREAICRKDQEQYRELLEKRKPTWYTEVVIPALRGLLGGEPARLIVGLPNRGRFPGISAQVIVEGWAVIESRGVHPEPLPQNPLCQQHIVDLGHLRTLAFAVMIDPKPDSLARYAHLDPFTSPIVSQGNLDRLLEECLSLRSEVI